jgi:hypothetical protein
MKKLLALALAAGLMTSLAVGCGDDTSKGTKDKAKTPPTTPAPGGAGKGAPSTPPKTDK